MVVLPSMTQVVGWPHCHRRHPSGGGGHVVNAGGGWSTCGGPTVDNASGGVTVVAMSLSLSKWW